MDDEFNVTDGNAVAFVFQEFDEAIEDFGLCFVCIDADEREGELDVLDHFLFSWMMMNMSPMGMRTGQRITYIPNCILGFPFD